MGPERTLYSLVLFLFTLIILIWFSTQVYGFSEDPESREQVERVLIHLRNIPQGNQSLPGSNGIVQLQRRRFNQKAQTLDAMASFYNVPADRDYTVKGYFQSSSLAFNSPVELWGIWKDVEIGLEKEEFTFVRNMPFVLDVRAIFQRNNSANPSLQPGEAMDFDVYLRNPSDENLRTRVTLLLKNKQTDEVIRLEKDLLLQSSQHRAHLKFNFVPERAGEYHFAVGIRVRQRINEWTDCWDWSEAPLFYVTREHRSLDFAGYHWDVKAGFGNPGGNIWSNDSGRVWIDGRGRLNLTLAPYANGRWYSTEVISQETFGFGTYTFFLDAEPQSFDPHVVAAIFLYKDEENEIDIEFSRWGDQENYQFGNYVIQPAEYPGNHFRFPILTSGSYTTHRIIWKPDEIVFMSWHGHYDEAPDGRIIARWQYNGDHIPDAAGLRLFFNIWLFQGITPKSDKAEIFTIAGFTFEPDPINGVPRSVPD